MSHRALAAVAFDDRDLLAVGRRAGERRVDRAFARLRDSVDDREIAPVDRMGGELLGQALVRDVGLCDDQQPRRILVDPVDDAGPGDAADARQRAAAMVEQRVDQRSVEIAGRRMNDQARRLVDDQQMLVLEDDLQRNVLRFVVRRRRLGDRNAQALRRPRTLVAGSRTGLPAGFHGAASDQGLQPFAREGRDGGGERAVKAPAGMGGLQAHVDRLNSPHS